LRHCFRGMDAPVWSIVLSFIKLNQESTQLHNIQHSVQDANTVVGKISNSSYNGGSG